MALEKKVKWLFQAIILFNVIIIVMVVLGALEPKRPKPFPNPNGYDDFVKAGKLFEHGKTHWMAMNLEELKSYILTNTEALNLLRIGMRLECRVPDNYSTNYMHQFVLDISSFRYLGQTFCAEGRLDLIEHRTNDAITCFLEDIQFGEKWTRGGIIVCKLIGIGSEYDGRRGLQTLIDELEAENCRTIFKTLETLDAAEEPKELFWEQEKIFVRKAASIPDRIKDLVFDHTTAQEKLEFYGKFQTNQILRREMMLTFATRAYTLEKGKAPDKLESLVPDYLKSIPTNPITGSNFVLEINSAPPTN